MTSAIEKNRLYKIFYFISILLFLGYVFSVLADKHEFSGWLLMFFFLSLSVAFRGNAFLKGLSFTVVIFAVVGLALYYPKLFINYRSFQFSALIVPLLQIIMFGMGTELSLKDFGQVLKIPKKILIGVCCHYTIMPLIAFVITIVFDFPSEIAAGIILVGCCPSGLASNVMCYLAKANLALSVSVTTISTLLAPFLTPFIMGLLAGDYVEVHVWDMVMDITKIVIIPIVGGLLFNAILHGRSKWLDKAMPIVSMAGIAIILTIMTAAGRDSLLQVGLILILATFIHNIGGYFFGYWLSRLFKLNEVDSRAIALEVGMQNAGLASGLALTMGKMATVGVASVVFGPMMNITGSSLASWWHQHDPEPEKERVKE